MADNDKQVGWPDPYEMPVTKRDYLSRMEYAISYFRKKEKDITKISNMKRKFIGNEVAQDMEYIKKAYVRNFRIQYHDYRIGYRIIMQMLGEWLRRPINSVVYAVNSNSMIETQDAASIHIGLYYTRNEVEHMREKGHGDPFDGLESAYDGANVEQLLSKLNSKQTRTMIMQFLLNNFIKNGTARDLLYYNYLDNILGASCWSEISLGPSGEVQTRVVDNRRVAYVEVDGDSYCEHTPFIVEERPMTYAQIVESWPELKEPGRKEDLLKLKSYFGVGEFFNNGALGIPSGYGETVNGQELLKVYISQFYIYEPRAQKTEIRNGKEHIADYDPKFYTENKYKINTNVRNGKYAVDLKHAKRTYTCAQLGPELVVGCGPVKDQITNPDDPLYATYDYCGMLFNTVMGKRTSIQELMIHLEMEYNVCRMILNRELSKFKGTILGYNRAFLPRDANNKPLNKETILATAVNDGILDYNSAADGNYAGETMDPKNLLQSMDLGLSKSMDAIVGLLYNLEDALYKIVGFNQERLGETPASATATNATNNLINSQASTSPIDYFFDRYSDRVFRKYIEKQKISLAFYRKREGDIILGPNLMALIRNDDNFADDFYGVYTADSRRDDFIRQKMSQRGEFAVSSGQQGIEDLMEAEMAETVQEAIAILKTSSQRIKEFARQQQKEQSRSAEQINQDNLNAMAEKDIRDKRHEIGKVIVEGAMHKAEQAETAISEYAMVMQEGENAKEQLQIKTDLENK